jgi:hypothetical protein
VVAVAEGVAAVPEVVLLVGPLAGPPVQERLVLELVPRQERGRVLVQPPVVGLRALVLRVGVLRPVALPAVVGLAAVAGAAAVASRCVSGSPRSRPSAASRARERALSRRRLACSARRWPRRRRSSR